MAAHILFITLRSPFARRIRLALASAGIDYREKVEDVFHPSEEFLRTNPLGLVPVLVLPGGTRIPDSATILEYIEDLRPGSIWPKDRVARESARALSTFAEGVMAATVAHFLETQRKMPDALWLQEHLETISRTLQEIYDRLNQDFPSQAGIDLGIALEYLSLRCPEFAWQEKFPKFLNHLDGCRKSELFRKTTPPSVNT